MFRKFVITLLAYMLLNINSNAGSDGELVLKKNCFNKQAIAFNQANGIIFKPVAL